MATTLQDIVFRDSECDVTNELNKSNCKVHIRVQQRSSKKWITTVEGLSQDLDLKTILKSLKKLLQTNGTIINDEEKGKILKFAGDNRRSIAKFLVQFNICDKDDLIIPGF